MRDRDYSDASLFLAKYFGETTTHNVEIRALSNERGAGPARPLFTREPDLVQEHCQIWDGPSRAVYFGVATRLNGRRTGTRKDLAELPALWCDIDCEKLGLDKEVVAGALVKNMYLPASVVIDSGYGCHGYWLLTESLDITIELEGTAALEAEIIAALKQLAGITSGDVAVCDLARVMRLPGTHNTKTGEMRLCSVLSASWARYEFRDLVDMLDWHGTVIERPDPAHRSPIETASEGVESNPYLDAAKRFGFKQPIDVEQRPTAMTYMASDETSIHQTRISVSSSLAKHGFDDEVIFDLLLAATQRAAGLHGKRWNWKLEEKLIRDEIRTAKAKYGRVDPPATGQAAAAPAQVIQLRGGGPKVAEQADAEKTQHDRAPQLSGFPLNDLGNANRLIVQHAAGAAAKLRYILGIGWHVWDGRRYKADPETIGARKLAYETARAMLVQASDIKASTPAQEKTRIASIKFAVGSGNNNRLSAMLTLAEPFLAADSDDFDRNPLILNCLNGTLDLQTGELRPHAPTDMLTKLSGASYDPEAQCPIWEKFISEIFDGDQNVIDFAQRMIGYTLTGDTSEHIVLILHGLGSNGKSVLIETLSAVMGEYVKRTPAETWVSKTQSGPTNDIAALAGARFVPVVETEHDKQLAEALVKQATGGDAITARFHFKEFFSFIPTFKLWLATNHKPRIRGSDYAIWRRILLLPFNVTFVDADKAVAGQNVKDLHLKDKLVGEFPGILAWMVRGCMAWQKGGLKPPATVIAATESYQDSQDNVSGFIRDCCHQSRGISCSINLLYAAYQVWCEENEEEPMPKRGFGKNLDERGYPPGPRTKRERLRKGIDLKHEYREAAPIRMAEPQTNG